MDYILPVVAGTRHFPKRSDPIALVFGAVRMGRVLVVEDDHAICELISGILEDAGFDTICVSTDVDAYAAINSVPALLALVVDINLGRGTTGFDVARFARQLIPELPVLYVSGDASRESFKAFGVPDSDFVTKPFLPNDLLATIQSRLAVTDSP